MASRQGETLAFGDSEGISASTLRGTVLSTLTVTQTQDNEWDIRGENVAPGSLTSHYVRPGDGVWLTCGPN